MASNEPDKWIFARLERFPLWEHFAEGADTNQAKVVSDLIRYVAPILERYVETFPTYTLHNHVHAENVVKLMGDILGPAVSELSVLESAMLILAAYFHDIGMVYTKADLNNLAQEPGFNEFLDIHPEAFVKVRQSKTIPIDIAAWYCRWQHADRVFIYLNRVYETDPAKLQWNTVSLKDTLGELCRSHVQDITVLRDDKTFPPNFLNSCDIPFCALLLRLADIMDFDRSRSPESVYGLLDLEGRKDPDDKVSETEWKKHLCATGFDFINATREPNYTVGFIAGPKNPAVEYDVNRFLDVIEREFASCSQILRLCSDRWRSFMFPARIDRENIISDGYKYGEHRFTLDQQHVLNLFMGENLYDDPYVFVRELLQNSIDTTRHRIHYEKSCGHNEFSPDPINVTQWRDADGYQWVRIDDFGMGMNEDIILKFLLRVGKSYYKSPEFEADKLRYAAHGKEEFTPISRFGIGLLSCFIVCDRLEINTLHVTVRGRRDDPIRLSLPGLHGFYKLQTGTHVPSPMPSKLGDDKDYRTSYGTSVAVRIDPAKDTGSEDLSERLERLVLCSPVRIYIEDQPVGGDPAVLIDHPWIKPETFKITSVQRKELGQVLDWKFLHPVEIHLVPLDLTISSLCREFKGQLAIAVVDSKELAEALRRISYDARLCIEGNKLLFEAHYSPPEHERRRGKQRKDCQFALVDLSARIPHRVLRSSEQQNSDSLLSWVSHNGITMPIFYREVSGRGPNASMFGRLLEIETDRVSGCYSVVMGLVTLSDSLRPDLSIARDTVRRLPWRLRSIANLTVRKAISKCESIDLPAGMVTIFDESLGMDRDILFGDLLKMTKSELPGWRVEDVVSTSRGLMSVETILQKCTKGQAVEIKDIPELNDWYVDKRRLSFTRVLRAFLIQCYLNVEVCHSGWDTRLMVKPESFRGSNEGLKFFPPLFFVPYRDSKKLGMGRNPLNARHRFSRWLVVSASALQKKLPGILDTIRMLLSSTSIYYWSGSRRLTYVISGINSALNRIHDTRDTEITPPKGTQLSVDDFEN